MPSLALPSFLSNAGVNIGTRGALTQQMGTAIAMNTPDHKYFGSIVNDWVNSKDGNVNSSLQENIDHLKTAATNGAFAVKYHMDYSRVLEDALMEQIYKVATQAIFYAGVVDVSNSEGLYSAGPSPFFNAPNGQDIPFLSIHGWLAGLENGVGKRSGAYFRIIDKTGSAASDVALFFSSTSQPLVVSAGDAIILRRYDDATDTYIFDKMDNVDPTIVGDSTLTVVRTGDNLYNISISSDYTATMNTAISTATSDAASYTDTAVAGVAGLVDDEAKARAAADASISADLASEVTRATGAEDTIQGNITAEVTRATGAEGTLSTKINAEVTRATAAESGLSDKISAEATARIAGDQSEATARTNADNALSGRIDTLRTDLSAETSNRQTADSTLQSNIDAEVSARQAAITSLATQVSSDISDAVAAEASARASADDGLSSSIAGVSSALDSEITARVAAVASEGEARATADQALDDKISKVASTLNVTLRSAADRLKILEAFVYATEQFVELSADGSTILDFTGALGALGWPSNVAVNVLADSNSTNYMQSANNGSVKPADPSLTTPA